MKSEGIVAAVIADSIADELGLEPGDRILEVNGEKIQDIIDLSFALADEMIELLIQKKDGLTEYYQIEKDYDEELGIEWESAVWNGVRRCANRCVFCFVDQMPQGMRESLYVKDDDYRLSFLYGNFVTLTNLTTADIERIKRLHLSPLYISVHTTNGSLRERMLQNKNASDILEKIQLLREYGIEMHFQIVLCPNINDGSELESTIADLYALCPQALSAAIVPVGLTRYRDKLYSLETFTKESAQTVIETVERWQKKCQQEIGKTFIHLGDEFYLTAQQPVPSTDWYDGFPQLENGIGLVRNFLDDWQQGLSLRQEQGIGYSKCKYIDVVCGVSAAKILAPLLDKLTIPNLQVRLVPVKNNFFGESITVTGLLTGKDIEQALTALDGERSGVIIPGNTLRKGEIVFLDNLTPEDLETKLAVPVRIAYFAQDLLELLYNWR